MKTQKSTTRTSLAATAAHNARWFAALIAGSAALSPGLVLAGTWTGAASTDWNNSAGNWSGGNGGTAQVNSTPANVATISANFTTIPTQILVGRGASANGRVNHVAGTATVAAGNDLVLGQLGGTGTYNLANTGVAGGTLTGFGLASGTVTIPDQVFVGGSITGTISTGNLNINTSGTLAVGTQMLVGNFGGTGTVKIDGGTVTVANDIELGSSPSATGTLSMSGGTITKSGGATPVTIGGGATPGGTGIANLNGGNFTSAGNFRVGHGSGSTGTLNLGGTNLTVNGEFWIGNNTGGTGTMNFSSGTLTTNNWTSVGRKDPANAGIGATGTLSMTGGTWNKNGTSNFIVGDTGSGTMTMSGGIVNVAPSATADRGITWIANANNCTGNLTISGSAQFNSPRFVVAVETGTIGTLNLAGGTVRTSSITGGNGDSTVNFDGTQIIATGSSSTFLDTLTAANVNAGGLSVDSAGFDLTAPVSLAGNGGVVKTGLGTLSLTGSNTHLGNHSVSAGKLALSTQSTGTGSFTVSGGAAMGVTQTSNSSTLTQTDVTFGNAAGTSLDIDLGDLTGNPFVPPLAVTGTLTLNGPVTLNVADLQPAVGSIPLVTYTAPKSGSGSFVPGTLPLGVSGNIVDDGVGTVSLNINVVAFPVWNGTANSTWDTTSQNWQDLYTNDPLLYADGLPVLFNDLAASTATNIDLPSAVAPGSLTFASFGNDFTISGLGKITGSTGLLQSGSADLTLNTANDFTGAVELQSGNTFINSPASLGAGTSPILLSGGNLNYTGPNSTLNRGLTVTSPGTIITIANSLTVSGPVDATGGSLIKEGPGNLTLSHPGHNVIGSVANGLLVQNGTMTFEGSGTQTNAVTGELWLANVPDVPANLVLNNTSLSTTSWISIGRGNGDAGVTNLTATNSTVNSVNFGTGFANNQPSNGSEAFVTLNNTVWNNTGVTYLAESSGSTSTMTLNGTSQFNINNTFLVARFADTTATLTLSGSSSVNKTGGFTSIGTEGSAVMNVEGTAAFNSPGGDFNVSDIGVSTGTLNLKDSGLVNVANVYIGKGPSTVGILNQTGGTFQSGNFIRIGNFPNGTGVVNISAGALTAGTVVEVGREGTGTLNVSGTATVTANGDGVQIGSLAGGSGTLNLNGGTVTTKRVSKPAGATSTVNFNGGVLRAGAGANAIFVGPIDTATIQSGGAFIDTNGQNLSISANLTGSGGLTKSGAGTLTLTGTYSYGGNTTVGTGGTLSLPAATLSNTSTVNIASGATLNLTHGTTDQIAGLVIAGTPLPAGSYVAGVQAGITGSGTLVVSGAVSPYNAWASSYGLNPATDGAPGFDKDGDGQLNSFEFALGGSPISGSNNAKIYSLVAEASAPAGKELLLTIAVRDGDNAPGGLPIISGSPKPTGSQDGYTYTIEGSITLNGFPLGATPVSVMLPPGVPVTPPTGYEWRTYSLAGSNNLPGKGFLRVNVTP